MFGVDTSELFIVALLALLVIGPKDLPNALRTVGRWYGQMRGMARHFTSGIESMIREAELEEMEKKWREENDRIMRQYPALMEAQTAEATEAAHQPVLPLDAPAQVAPVPDPLSPPAESHEKRDLP